MRLPIKSTATLPLNEDNALHYRRLRRMKTQSATDAGTGAPDEDATLSLNEDNACIE